MGLEIEKVQRIIPEQYNLNLAAKRMKNGDIQFDMPVSLNFPYLMQLAKQVYKQGYQSGTGTFEYRDPAFTFNLPRMDFAGMLRTAPVRGPQTISTATSW